jgi:uncharacterized protein
MKAYIMQFTQDHVRTIVLATMGLATSPTSTATKADVLATIRRMRVLQIDTINVVARSPYLVLWSRLGNYSPRWLEELLAEGAIFEYWSHEACFLPGEDYPLHRTLMLHGQSRRSWAYSQQWLADNRMLVDQLIQHIRSNGPVRSADFQRTDGQKGGWWNWKAEKMALEMLFMAGELMITKRHNFQRIYDLRERVVPTWDDSQALSLEEARRAFTAAAVKALGITPAGWVADYFRTRKLETIALVRKLAAEQELVQVRVEGWAESAYLHPDTIPLAEQVLAGAIVPEYTTLLSPFDPLVWDRARASALFNFDYRIECYTPAPKRRYGYFTLPILNRGAIVGRLDPKAHRKERIFEVKALHLEPWVTPTDALAADIAVALHDCANWHGTPEVAITMSDPPEFAQMVRKAL